MNSRLLTSLAILSLAAGWWGATSPAVGAHEAHEHGAARLTLALDGGTVTLELDSPLANFMSFEHAPATPAQREEAAALAARLRQAEDWFVLSAGGCAPRSVTLRPDYLEGRADETAGQAHDDAGQAAEEDEHADLEATFTFVCARPAELNRLEVKLFEGFPDLQEIEAQWVTPKGQGAAELKPGAGAIAW